MAIIANCSVCKKPAEVAFHLISGQKFTRCSCGNTAPAIGLEFDSQPEFLFKYRPHDGYSESWILKEELFFASPAMFNDPFDSKVMHSFDGTPEQKKKWLSQQIDTQHPEIRKKEKWKIINKALKGTFFEETYDPHVTRIKQRIDEYGVVSFSRKPNDLLMFSYYAKDHTGYCLKYARNRENILSMAEPVFYEKNYPKFSVFEYNRETIGDLGDRILRTKAECWKHEDEWRISFATIDPRVIKLPHPILAGIILGCNMKPQDRSKIIEINKRRAKPVALFEARKKKFEFALEIVPITS